MGLIISSAPAIEPVTLSEVKAHLRLDTGSYVDGTASTISIAPDAWPITAAYGIVGTGVDVLTKRALVQFSVGTVAAGATLDYKIQESAALGSGYTDWTGQTYTQITAAGTYEKEYTGIKQYIRVVATVAVGAIDFGASIITRGYQTDDDTMLTTLITVAREIAEATQGRSFINRTYTLTLDEYPVSSSTPIYLPRPPLSSVTSINSYDTDGDANLWDDSEYQVDITGFVGRIMPAYGYSWPSITLRQMEGVSIIYVAGYGATAASVPYRAKQAILLIIGELWENREDTDIKEHYKIPLGIRALLGFDEVVKT